MVDDIPHIYIREPAHELVKANTISGEAIFLTGEKDDSSFTNPVMASMEVWKDWLELWMHTL